MAFFYQGYQQPEELRIRSVKCEYLHHHSLLRIIGRICEYSRIKSPYNSIQTLNNDTMPICTNEIVIQQECPLGMERLPPAVGKEGISGAPSDVDPSEVLKRIGQLVHPRQHYEGVGSQATGAH
jgi:hypothetical protein